MEIISFVERQGAQAIEVARFDGTWTGNTEAINGIMAELESRAVDIATMPAEVLKVFSGSYFWAITVPKEPTLVIPQT